MWAKPQISPVDALAAHLVREVFPLLSPAPRTAPRDQMDLDAQVAPYRKTLAAIGGENWETEHSAKSLSKHILRDGCPVSLDDVLAAWLARTRDFPDSREVFQPAPKHADISVLLKANGYLNTSTDGVRWTEKAQVPMTLAQRWASDGASSDDRRQAARVHYDTRQYAKAQVQLDSMPSAHREKFIQHCEGSGVLGAYDWLYAYHYQGEWQKIPRQPDQPSIRGKLNVPEMGIATAADMYRLVTGHSLGAA